jgi:predicted  nucleic acid-binding Zn-ribbon protein
MENKKVLTKEELDNLKTLKKEFEELTKNAGSITLQIMDLEMYKDQIKTQLIDIRDKETKLIKDLENKYGLGTISIDTGEFIPK